MSRTLRPEPRNIGTTFTRHADGSSRLSYILGRRSKAEVITSHIAHGGSRSDSPETMMMAAIRRDLDVQNAMYFQSMKGGLSS